MWRWNSHIFANHCLWKEHNVTMHMYDGILGLEKKIKAPFKTTKPKQFKGIHFLELSLHTNNLFTLEISVN